MVSRVDRSLRQAGYEPLVYDGDAQRLSFLDAANPSRALARAAIKDMKCAQMLAETENAVEAMVDMLTKADASGKNKTRAAEVLGLIALAGPKYRTQVRQCEGARSGLRALTKDRTLSMPGQQIAAWAHMVVENPDTVPIAEVSWNQRVAKRSQDLSQEA